MTTLAPPEDGRTEPLAQLALLALPLGLAGATVLAQIAYPLTHGAARARLTVVTVVLFFLASVSHALLQRGARWTSVLVVVTLGGGLLAEAVGLRTGFPFGSYSYASSLGAKLLGVPIVIPLAWTMMAYPALLVGRHLARSRVARVLVSGFALAAWDLFLDPQMVAEGHWAWRHPSPGLNHVPLTNYAGWLGVALMLMAVLEVLLPDVPDRDVLIPFALYFWTYWSSVLADVAFFHRPYVGLAGGVGMGLVVVPLVLSLRGARRVRLAATG